MKFKIIKFGILVPLLIFSFFSCKEDSNDSTWLANSNTDPIEVYKVVDPINYDAIITEAKIKQLIKLVGKNLDNVKTVSINGVVLEMPLDANLLNGVLYVRIPYERPADDKIDNLITLTDIYGNVATTPISIFIPSISALGMDFEWAAEGSEMTILGDFFDFYQMVDSLGAEVTIGGVKAPILKTSPTELTVKVPAGAGENSDIILTNPKGLTVTCNSKYKNTDAVITNFSDRTLHSRFGKWIYKDAAVDADDPEPIDGMYLQYKGEHPGGWNSEGWGVLDMYSGDNPNIPTDINTNRSAYNFKFEAWTENKLEAFLVRFEFESWDPGETRCWWYTEGESNEPVVGKWQTIVIPAEKIAGNNSPLGDIKCFRIVDQSSEGGYFNIAIDNPRFVLK